MSLSEKKRKILEQKPEHEIDASVLFGGIDGSGEESEFCEAYLGAMGHKYKGYASIPLIGETFLAINKVEDDLFREKAANFVNRLLDRGKLQIVSISEDRDDFVEILKGLITSWGLTTLHICLGP